MHGCRICGRLTGGGAPLCGACGTELESWERLDSPTPHLPIPMRRYGVAPALPAEPPGASDGVPEPAWPGPLIGGALLALAGSGAVLAALLALALGFWVA